MLDKKKKRFLFLALIIGSLTVATLIAAPVFIDVYKEREQKEKDERWTNNFLRMPK